MRANGGQGRYPWSVDFRERDCHENLAPAERESKVSLLFRPQSPSANSETLRV